MRIQYDEITKNLKSFLQEKDPNFSSFLVDFEEEVSSMEEEKKEEEKKTNQNRKKDPSKRFEKIKMIVFVKE